MDVVKWIAMVIAALILIPMVIFFFLGIILEVLQWLLWLFVLIVSPFEWIYRKISQKRANRDTH